MSWVVEGDWLRCRTHRYDIRIARLGETREFAGEHVSDWILHMAEKEWVDMGHFCAAFGQALHARWEEYEPLTYRAVEAAKREAVKMRQHLGIPWRGQPTAKAP